MKLVSIQSATITQIGFEEGIKLALNMKPVNIMKVIFTDGIIYDYYGIEKKVFEDFLKAESHGIFFEANIKDKYQYEKVNN